MNTVCGLNRCSSPSRRHWYSPPTISERWLARTPSAGKARRCWAQHLLGEHVEPDAAQARRGAGEAGLDDVGAQPDGLEDLRAGVGGDRRDAHLRHGLAHALAQRLDQVRRRPWPGRRRGCRRGRRGPRRWPWPGTGSPRRRRSRAAARCGAPRGRRRPRRSARPGCGVRSRTRWWCTAPVSSSDGIGALSASTPRLDSTISRAPSSIASETSSAISVEPPEQARRRPRPPGRRRARCGRRSRGAPRRR